ncbi:MAG: hypothetical protein RR139_01445 [Lachnospiraceae bacterium]
MKNANQDIICNCCKKIIPLTEDMRREEYLHIHKEWGYFSKKDGEIQEFDICEACYDTWTASFQIPVTKKEVTELV